MKILVLTEDYPNNDGGVTLMYVHTRNVYYHEHGVEVDNLSFSVKNEYIIDGIRVINLEIYEKENNRYDLLVLHAANLRHHYKFLKKYEDKFSKLVFFYHGHEVLKIHSVYSKPYPYVHENKLKVLLQNIYDDYKLYIWRKYLPKVCSKSWFVFVSNWMLEEFEKWTRIKRDSFNERYSITYNCVAKDFEENQYSPDQPIEYDFVTIRGNLDGSKYSVDLVNEMAKKTPNARFLVVGKGNFFKFNEKAENIEWWDRTLSHDTIVNVLNKSRYALMPTRTDAQGLMMCEMAAFGIPVITSNIPVCHEVFDGFQNVEFIDNDCVPDLSSFLEKEMSCQKDTRFYCEKTVGRELKLLQSLVKGAKE